MLAHAEHLLHTSRILEVSGLHEYLRGDYADPWSEPELKLSIKRSFGIRECGYVTTSDGISQIHFPYREVSIYRVAMTLHVLFAALYWCMEREGALSNQHQLCTISTRCEHKSMGWGHAMTGDVFPVMRRWLAGLQDELREGAESMMSEAVLEAYVAFRKPKERREARRLWRDTCYGRIRYEGRFIIQCPGNACDIAIYPEGDSWDESYTYAKFSCHNLDSAVQQLCLLAGLATLCEIAREDLEK